MSGTLEREIQVQRKEEGIVAPCNPDGSVVTLDQETREGVCVCSRFCCLVDRNNNIIHKTATNSPVTDHDLQPTV